MIGDVRAGRACTTSAAVLCAHSALVPLARRLDEPVVEHVHIYVTRLVKDTHLAQLEGLSCSTASACDRVTLVRDACQDVAAASVMSGLCRHNALDERKVLFERRCVRQRLEVPVVGRARKRCVAVVEDGFVRAACVVQRAWRAGSECGCLAIAIAQTRGTWMCAGTTAQSLRAEVARARPRS